MIKGTIGLNPYLNDMGARCQSILSMSQIARRESSLAIVREALCSYRTPVHPINGDPEDRRTIVTEISLRPTLCEHHEDAVVIR